ncbi:MAG: hypothetical protein U0822_22335 [Anaerolineae bacterium]
MRHSGLPQMDKAEQARDKLVRLVFTDPRVSMVDIGAEGEGEEQVPVLRVHVKGGAEADEQWPKEIDGIAVRVISGDYRLQ